MADIDAILREFNMRPCKVILAPNFGITKPPVRRSKRILELNKNKNVVPAKRAGRSKSVFNDAPKEVSKSNGLKPASRVTKRSNSLSIAVAQGKHIFLSPRLLFIS